MLTTLIGLGITSVVSLSIWAFTQKEHTLLRIYGPAAIVRWVAEDLRPKLTQYSERDGVGRPFPLVKRNWAYRASKGLPTTEGFGTQKDLHTPGTHTIRPAPFGITSAELPDDSFSVPVGRDGRHFKVRFPVNRSGGSFGAFGAHWTRAASDGCGILNQGSLPGEGFLDCTGEGGLAPHHLSVCPENQEYLDRLNERAREAGHGYFFRFDRTDTSDGKIIEVPLAVNYCKINSKGRVDVRYRPDAGLAASELPRRLIVQIGPALAGYRTKDGQIDWEWLDFICGLPDVAGIEIKAQQGAKPNDASTVKAAKLTAELRALRGFHGTSDYVSPERLPFIRPLGEKFYLHIPKHIPGPNNWEDDGSARDEERQVTLSEQVGDLVDTLTRIQNLPNVKQRGLITGFKMTYCGPEFLDNLAQHLRTGQGPDYLIVDGAEGGTGAADPVMTDHVGVHTYQGIVRTHQILKAHGVRDKVRLVASGRILDGADAAKVLALGADYCNAIRGFMFATGCIQALTCHNNQCPSGITTHHSWRLRGFDPTLKAVRFANYGLTLRSKLVKLARVAGVDLSKGQKFELRHLDVVTGIGKMTRGDEVYLP